MKTEIESLLNPYIKELNSKSAINRRKDAIRLDKGELPYPPSPHVIEAISNAASEINRYPDILGGVLREALAEYNGVKTEQIVVGNGSDDLIELIVKVFVKQGEEVILPIPTFFVYDFATKVVGGIPIWVKRNEDFSLNIDAIKDKITSKTKVLFIANPNNPTANLTPREILIEILEQVDSIVVIDECYYEFSQETVVDLIEKYPNLIILRSLSKSFGLAGIRIGYSIANEVISDYLYRIAQLFPVNKMAIVAGKVALENKKYIDSNIHKIQQEKKELTKELTELGFTVYPSDTNFLFIGTKSLNITSKNIVKLLKEQNILVADFGLKQGLDGYYLRTAIGKDKENQILLAGLKKTIQKFSNH